MATASILDEDGHATSLGKLGLFANKDGALAFAVRCTTAFIDGDDMPLPPFQLSSQRGAPAFRRAVSPGPGLRCQPMNVASPTAGRIPCRDFGSLYRRARQLCRPRAVTTSV
jgi:hypothetical protein